MAVRSGLAAQIGYAEESAAGTFTVPNRFVPLVSESLTADRGRLEAAGIIPGRQLLRSPQWNGGPITVGGDVKHELYQAGLGVLLKHMFGSVVTTGAGPFTHEFRIADPFGLSLTAQVGRPGMDGTVHPYSYVGCKIAEAEIAVEADEIATAGFTLLGMSESLAEPLAVASYIDDQARPYKFNHAAITVAGVAQKVKSATLGFNNSQADDRRFLGQQTIDEPVLVDLREITCELTVEHQNQAAYQRVVDGTEVAFEVGLTAGANSLIFEGNGRSDGVAAVVVGKGIVEQKITLKVVADDTDVVAFFATMVNSQAAV